MLTTFKSSKNWHLVWIKKEYKLSLFLFQCIVLISFSVTYLCVAYAVHLKQKNVSYTSQHKIIMVISVNNDIIPYYVIRIRLLSSTLVIS